MFWSSGTLRLSLLAVVCAAVWAQKPPKLEKPRKHGLGFSYALPKDWKYEDGSEAVVLLPPGVTVDADREDNAEVYVISEAEGLNGPEDPSAMEWLKSTVMSAGVSLEREYAREVFTNPGKPGAIYTLDATARGKPMRVRAFIVKVKGKLLMLRASGERQRLIARDPALRAIAASMDW